MRIGIVGYAWIAALIVAPAVTALCVSGNSAPVVTAADVAAMKPLNEAASVEYHADFRVIRQDGRVALIVDINTGCEFFRGPFGASLARTGPDGKQVCNGGK